MTQLTRQERIEEREERFWSELPALIKEDPQPRFWTVYFNRLAFSGNRVLRDAFDDIRTIINKESLEGRPYTSQVIPLELLKPVAKISEQKVTSLADISTFAQNIESPWLQFLPKENILTSDPCRSLYTLDVCQCPDGHWYIASTHGWIGLPTPR